jgi:hypothetical protein
MSKLAISQIEKHAASTQQEISIFKFDAQQAHLLHKFSEEIATIGGPQASGARLKAAFAATELKFSFSIEQHELIKIYSDGLMSMLVFDGLQTITNSELPQKLPELPLLEGQYDVLCLAARNQILLKLVDHRTFAYDIDNEGKLVRLVANFKGGGLEKIHAEPKHIELSSHAGLSLEPHTEAPYWCAVKAENGHSPSPSALILSSLWNPLMEPTSVIPLPSILNDLGVANCLALTSRSFNFTRSDSFVNGKGEDGKNVSILDFNEKIGFAARFNSYRFSVDENASDFAKKAYQKLFQAINDAIPYQHALTQNSAIIINNNRALHCRDIVKDNRRLLVRLFGLSKFSEPIVISEDPLLLRG